MNIIKSLVLISICSSIVLELFAQETYKKTEPLAHTFSIVARDPATGQMAVAVQSHWFSVGTLVAWGKSGVGVIATQSFVNPSYGPNGLKLMEDGMKADDVLNQLLSKDEGENVRQVAVLDASGLAAAHTGDTCIPYASHILGDGYSVQANMMLTDIVPNAMASAYDSNSSLPFAERVLSALMAAQNAGGDIRGKQSAVLLVVSGDKNTPEWADKIIDLRVDDNPEPLKELTRLLKVHRAYEHMNKGDLAVENGNMGKAMQEYSAAEILMPNNLEMKFWKAVTMANNGNIQTSSQILYRVYSDMEYGQNWRKLLARLPEVGLLTVSDEDLEVLKNPEKYQN